MDGERVQVDHVYKTAYEARHPDHPGLIGEGDTVNDALRDLGDKAGESYTVSTPYPGEGDTPEEAQADALRKQLGKLGEKKPGGK